jgi:hypothetical protein
MDSMSEPHPRHRAHEAIKVAGLAFSALVLAGAVVACGGSLRRPKAAPIRVTEYVAVPYPPRPATVEIVPLKPTSDPKKPPAEQFDEDDLVWADGTWEWRNDRYQWDPGAWVTPPKGATRTRWALVRRKEDGQLFFAPSRWRASDAPDARDIEAPRALVRSATRQADD